MTHELGLDKTQIPREKKQKSRNPLMSLYNTILIIEHQIEESVADVSEHSLMLIAVLQKLSNCSCCSHLKKNTTEGT